MPNNSKTIPKTIKERQRKYLQNPENKAKHIERQKIYYINVTKPKRDALRKLKLLKLLNGLN